MSRAIRGTAQPMSNQNNLPPSDDATQASRYAWGAPKRDQLENTSGTAASASSQYAWGSVKKDQLENTSGTAASSAGNQYAWGSVKNDLTTNSAPAPPQTNSGWGTSQQTVTVAPKGDGPAASNGWGQSAASIKWPAVTVPSSTTVSSTGAPLNSAVPSSSWGHPPATSNGATERANLQLNLSEEKKQEANKSAETDPTTHATSPTSPMDPALLQKLISVQLANTTSEENISYPDGQGGDNLRSSMLWQEFNFPKDMIRGLASMGFRYPSGIQARALPATLLDRNHVIVQSQNGTGKTGTYLITSLSVIDYSQPHCQALVMVNTHELAQQVADVARQIGKYFSGFRVAVAIPGMAESYQDGPVNAQLVVGTPGTLVHWAVSKNASKIDLKKVAVFVMDEADKLMEDEAFFDIVRLIRKRLRPECQILFFSATFDDEVREYARELLGDVSSDKVTEILLSVHELALKNVRQFKMRCPTFDDKLNALLAIYRTEVVTGCLVFCKTREAAHKLADAMRAMDHCVGVLTGKMTPPEREKEIERFRHNEVRALISTNVCSRGLDIDQLNLVVNWDLPMLPSKDNDSGLQPDYDTYLHRVGRTGRFGRYGLAINFISNDREDTNLAAIEQHFGITVPAVNYLDAQDMERVTNPKNKNDRFE